MFNDAFKVNEISNYAGILGGFKLLLEVKNVKENLWQRSSQNDCIKWYDL